MDEIDLRLPQDVTRLLEASPQEAEDAIYAFCDRYRKEVAALSEAAKALCAEMSPHALSARFPNCQISLQMILNAYADLRPIDLRRGDWPAQLASDPLGVERLDRCFFTTRRSPVHNTQFGYLLLRDPKGVGLFFRWAKEKYTSDSSFYNRFLQQMVIQFGRRATLEEVFLFTLRLRDAGMTTSDQVSLAVSRALGMINRPLPTP